MKKLEILYQDKYLIVVNKPADVLSIPDRFVPEKPNLLDILRKEFGQVWVVHRLDKATSGVICFALDADTHKALSMQFQERKVKKLYHALVEGCPLSEKGEIDRAIAAHPTIAGKMMPSSKGKAARTDYRVLTRYRDCALLEADIKTGRTHQIRVHFSSLGHPLMVDPLYGKREALFLSEIKRKNFRLGKNTEERPLLSRLSLHAHSLEIQHPHREELLQVEAPYFKDFRAVLNQLNKWNAL
ncbi:MAG TPA: RluA family pseudouridine synthase [Saprospiraceae bacterium]|nr:RluA family pseudouridine synthase [Saprospiraceae bacterium]